MFWTVFTFELAYWYYGLKVAQTWRERLGLEAESHWADIIAKLSSVDPRELSMFASNADTLHSFLVTRWTYETLRVIHQRRKRVDIIRRSMI